MTNKTNASTDRSAKTRASMKIRTNVKAGSWATWNSGPPAPPVYTGPGFSFTGQG